MVGGCESGRRAANLCELMEPPDPRRLAGKIFIVLLRGNPPPPFRRLFPFSSSTRTRAGLVEMLYAPSNGPYGDSRDTSCNSDGTIKIQLNGPFVMVHRSDSPTPKVDRHDEDERLWVVKCPSVFIEPESPSSSSSI